MKTKTYASNLAAIACGASVLAALTQPAFGLQQGNQMADALAFLGAFFLVFLLVAVAAYVYGAICLQTIAKKTHTPNGWLAWIPVGNLVLMINIAKKPMWWIVFFLVPFIGPVFTLTLGKLWYIVLVPLLIVEVVLSVIIWMAVAKARNKPEWLGILIIVPLVNLVVLGYLAFSGDAAGAVDYARPASPDWAPNGKLSLYCVSGEFANNTVEVPPTGLYIGRDPSKANLVLSSHEVSGVHAYVVPESGGSQLGVEDWNSLNGTYYQVKADGSPSQWVPLKGKILLSRGARIRLGDNIAEFEVRA